MTHVMLRLLLRMLLSTFPFRTFKEGFLNSIFPNDNFSGARIVKLPSLYVYYLGGLLSGWKELSGLTIRFFFLYLFIKPSILFL